MQAKGREVASCLYGQCVFLVGWFSNLNFVFLDCISACNCNFNSNEFEFSGMMGSGKTTVGEILSDTLDYTFADRLVSRLIA